MALHWTRLPLSPGVTLTHGVAATLVKARPWSPICRNRLQMQTRGHAWQWQSTIALFSCDRLGHTQTLIVRDRELARCASSAVSYCLLLSISVSYPWCNVHRSTVLRSRRSSAKHKDSIVYISGLVVESKVASGA